MTVRVLVRGKQIPGGRLGACGWGDCGGGVRRALL